MTDIVFILGPPGTPEIIRLSTQQDRAFFEWSLTAENTGGYTMDQLQFKIQYQIVPPLFNWNGRGSCLSCTRIPSSRNDGDEELQNLRANTTYAVRIIVFNPAGHNVSAWKVVITKGIAIMI